MNKGTTIFAVFMWSVWLLYGYLMFFENSSRIYKAANNPHNFEGMITFFVIWGLLLTGITASSLNEEEQEDKDPQQTMKEQ